MGERSELCSGHSEAHWWNHMNTKWPFPGWKEVLFLYAGYGLYK